MSCIIESSKTVIYPLQKFFDFGYYIPGIKVLRLMLWLQVLILLLSIGNYCNVLILQIIKLVEISALEAMVQHLLSIIIIICDTIPIYLLWKGIKLVSRKHLKLFLIARLILLVPVVAIYLLYKIYGSWQVNNDLQHLINVILKVTSFVIRIYTICVIYIYHKKLDSPITTYFNEHFNVLKKPSLKEVEASKNIDNMKEPEKNNNFTSEITQMQFQTHILSPFDVMIDYQCQLGEGEFGTVFKGTFYTVKSKLAITAKVAKDVRSTEIQEMMLQELKNIIYVGDHENIVKFYGITSDASIENHIALITEYCSHGCLEDFLKKNRHTFVDLSSNSGKEAHLDNSLIYTNLEAHGTHTTIDLIRFAVEISSGMEHLASKRIVHGDLSCRNVLLTQNLTAKVTDFGMSRRLYAYQMQIKMQDQKIPWRWMSIEAIEDLNLSEKSDVWSFGVTLWEVFTLGQFPFEDVQWSSDISERLRQGLLKLSKPRYAELKLYNVMKECWNIDPCDRPTFCDLKTKLENFSSKIALF